MNNSGQISEILDFVQINAPYLLVSCVPFYSDNDKQIWLDRLWAQDLQEQLEYVQQLTLVAPKYHLNENNNAALICFDQSKNSNKIRFVALRPLTSKLSALLLLPNTIRILWQEILKARIVHSGIVGWPIPLGWIANPITLFLRRRLVLVIESAPWRLVGEGPFALRYHIKAYVTEHLGRFFMRRADLSIATQPSYLESLRGECNRGIDLVTPATWINDINLISIENAKKLWADKDVGLINSTRFLFAGRLTSEKGINVLLQAIISNKLKEYRVELDIIGNGPLLEKCIQFEVSSDQLQIRVLPFVEYGNPFFELLQHYHAVFIPSLSDEQPRIIFDAYSQAVPVIASNTDGIRPYVDDGITGWLITAGSSTAIEKVISEIMHEPDEVKRRGLAALKAAQSNTHREMHRKRSHALAQLI